MVDLTPPFIRVIRELLFSLESGDSLSAAVPRALAAGEAGTPSAIAEHWVHLRQNAIVPPPVHMKNPYHQIFCELLTRGAAGQPIASSLKHLLAEAEAAARSDLDRHISLLPFKALFPLLVFQFPAFLVLLIGPLLRQLKNIAFSAILLAVSARSGAQTLDQIFLRKLESVRSPQAVETLRKRYKAIQVERRACRVQLEEGILPKSCYKTIRLETQFGLRPDRKAQTETLTRLDDRCLEAHRLTRLPDAGSLTDLSAKCRKEVLKARELQRYRGRSET